MQFNKDEKCTPCGIFKLSRIGNIIPLAQDSEISLSCPACDRYMLHFLTLFFESFNRFSRISYLSFCAGLWVV